VYYTLDFFDWFWAKRDFKMFISFYLFIIPKETMTTILLDFVVKKRCFFLTLINYSTQTYTNEKVSKRINRKIN
jgi:hypothetical protein